MATGSEVGSVGGLAGGQIVFTTDAYPVRERTDAFREEFARRALGLEFEQQGNAPIRASVAVRPLGPLMCAQITTSATRYARTRQMMRDGDDSIVFGTLLSGHVEASQSDYTMQPSVGEATLLWSNHASKGQIDGAVLSIKIERSRLTSFLPSALSLGPRALNANDPLGRLISGYVRSFLDLPPGLAAETEETFARHLLELVALALGARGDAREEIQARGLRAARRRAVVAEIETGFSNPDFRCETVAGRLGISERYVRQLLEEAGATFTERVLDHRLRTARALLADRQHDHLKISEIGYLVGFSDLSYFNRSFRRRFGATPGDVRYDKHVPEVD